MSRLAQKLHSYRLRRASGQALVILDGKDFYLGVHGTQTSKAEYDRLIAEWLAHGRCLPTASGGQSDLTINEWILAYLRFAEGHYTRDGKPTRHVANIKDAVRPLRSLYGYNMAADFGFAAFKSVRRAMLDARNPSVPY